MILRIEYGAMAKLYQKASPVRGWLGELVYPLFTKVGLADCAYRRIGSN